MSKKNQTPETTGATTDPSKRISLRKERVRTLRVESNVRTGGGIKPPCTGRSLIVCEVSSPQ